MSQVGTLSNSLVLAGSDLNIMVASSDVISSNPSNLERVRESTVGGVEPAVRDRMSSTFFVKKFWNATAARGHEFS